MAAGFTAGGPGGNPVAPTGTPGRVVTQNGVTLGYYDAAGNFVSGPKPAGTNGDMSITSTPTTTGAGGTAQLPGDMTALTGWMAGYAPGMAPNIYDNPQDLLADVMQQNGGYNAASPVFQTLSRLQGADPLTLYMLSVGANQGALGSQNVNDYGNYLGSMYLNQMTPGGGTFNFANMMSNLFGMPTQGTDGADNASPLYNLVTAGDANDQVQNVYNMIRDAARVGLNPLAAQAALTATERAGTDYRRDVMKNTGGDVAPFYQWLAANQPGLVGAMSQR